MQTLLHSAIWLSSIIFLLFTLLFSSNYVMNSRHLLIMNENEKEFQAIDIFRDPSLTKAIKSLPDNYGVILLNQYALKMTLNWLCNTAYMGIHHRILFFVLDSEARLGLQQHYSNLTIVQWKSPVLENSFKPFDSTYMSFFLMRTNLIQALQFHGKPFWMLQADTIWASNPLQMLEKMTNYDILVDQQGYEGIADSRKKIMNGANFYIPTSSNSKSLVHSWLSWQRWVYITDPDIVKMFCLSHKYNCGYIPHNIVSGWEWIYGDQSNPPMMIQMDGETDGGKEKVLEKYGFWFLNEKLSCEPNHVRKAIENIRGGSVPRVYSASKEKQNVVLKLGEWLNQMPIFGYYSSIYGGITSLYLQLFNFSLQ